MLKNLMSTQGSNYILYTVYGNLRTLNSWLKESGFAQNEEFCIMGFLLLQLQGRNCIRRGMFEEGNEYSSQYITHRLLQIILTGICLN
jgi:hypothetical protein